MNPQTAGDIANSAIPKQLLSLFSVLIHQKEDTKLGELEVVLELHGLTKKGEAKRVFRLEECLRCGRKKQSESVRCRFCGFILDSRLAEEIEQKTNERNAEIQDRLRRLEQTVTSLLKNQSNGSVKSMSSLC